MNTQTTLGFRPQALDTGKTNTNTKQETKHFGFKTHNSQRGTHNSQLDTRNLRIVPLGGVEEIGINCTVYEHGSEMIVVDLGLGFSEFDYYGIDAVVPDIKYILKKRQKLKGIFITHGHLDHIGAIAYHIETLDFPDIYGSQFTLELIKTKLDEKGFLGKMQGKLHTVDENSVIKLKDFTVKFFHVNHSIPQSLGIFIQTAAGNVVQTGDFKFDNTPINEPVADYARIAEYGKTGVDILLADSTNSLKKGHPISESEVAKNLEDVIEKASGRVIVATFSGLVGRLYQLLEIAKKHNRRVVITGYSMNQTLKIAENIGYIKMHLSNILPISSVNKVRAENTLILTTGAQGEPDAALSKMAEDNYRGISIKKGDTVILSAKTIPGNDRAVQTLVDTLTRKGATVRQVEDMDLFTSGHGYQEDQKIMLNLTKPKHFMPVHGYQYFLRAHAETAKSVGVKEENIIIPQRGSIIEGNSKIGFKIVKKFNCEPLLVSGSGVGDVGTIVLKEREQLASFGIIVITLTLDKDKKLLRAPFVLTKGFVYVKSSQELLQQISKTTEDIYNKMVAQKEFDTSAIKDEISNQVDKLVYKETEREPIIMTILNYV